MAGIGCAPGPGVWDLVTWLQHAGAARPRPCLCRWRQPHVSLRHRFIFKVNKIRGFEPEVSPCSSPLPVYTRQPQIPFQDLLTHADGTRTPASRRASCPTPPALERLLNENLLSTCHSSVIIHSQDAFGCFHIIWSDTE